MPSNSQNSEHSVSPSRIGGIRRSESQAGSEGILRRSWHTMADFLSPFSNSALQNLPDTSRRDADRELRSDRIPDPLEPGIRETMVVTRARNGQAIDPVPIRVPKKIATPIKVEGKVWFANERTWIAYLNMAILLGTLALALFNASEDHIARNFAYVYAVISIGVLVYGWVLYQKRITMIRRRDPGQFDQLLGPVLISVFLFFAVLSNFIIRFQELRRKAIPLPDED